MVRRAVWAALMMAGTVIGAGFASGREIAAFFSRYGAWSWAGVAAAVLLMGLLAPRIMSGKAASGGKWLWLLPGVTAGAMACASGELLALLLPLPWQGGYAGGMAVSCLLGWGIARSRMGLGGVSLVMSMALLIVMVMALALPPLPGTYIAGEVQPAAAMLRAAAYAGFNLTLAAPLLKKAGKGLSRKHQWLAAWLGAGLLAALLTAGNGLMLQNPVLMDSPLPLVNRMRSLGQAGFFAVSGVMYLAVLTTLASCMAALRQDGRRWVWIAPAVSALGGFSSAVDRGYPLLGVVGLISLIWPGTGGAKSGK